MRILFSYGILYLSAFLTNPEQFLSKNVPGKEFSGKFDSSGFIENKGLIVDQNDNPNNRQSSIVICGSTITDPRDNKGSTKPSGSDPTAGWHQI